MQDVITAATPASRQLYSHVLHALKPLGPFREELKKTCVHLVRQTAFAGVHFRKEHLLLTVKSEKPVNSKRVAKLAAEGDEYAGNNYFQKADDEKDGMPHMGLLPMQGQHRPDGYLYCHCTSHIQPLPDDDCCV